MDSGRYTETFVIDKFPGFFFGPSGTNLIPGSLVDGGSTADGFSLNRNVRLTDSGELSGAGGYSQFGGGYSTNTSHPTLLTSLYHWKPSYGGDYIMGGRPIPQFLTYNATYGMLMNDVHSRDFPIETRYSSQSPNTSFAMFEPFGDNLYYCDGINFPLRISLNGSTSTPESAPMGVGNLIDASGLFFTASLTPRMFLGGPVQPGTTYVCTFLTLNGESLASPTNAVTVRPSDVTTTVANGPTGVFPVFSINWSLLGDMSKEVIFLNIYRKPVGGSVFQLVTRIANRYPDVQTWVDTKTDGELGVPLTLDNGMPTQFRLLCAYNNRMFGVGGYGNPNRIACSKIGQPDVWPPLYEMVNINKGRGQRITQMREINGSLYFFFTGSIYRLIGFSPEDFSLEEVSNHIGCIAPRSMVPWEDGVIFLSRSGVFFFDGTSPKNISTAVYDWFLRMNATTLPEAACGAIAANTYYLSFLDNVNSPNSSSSENNKSLLINLSNGSCGISDLGFDVSCQVGTNNAMVGSTSGQTLGAATIYLLSHYLLANNVNVAPTLRVPNLDCGSPDSVKILERVEVWYEALDELTVSCTATRETPKIELPVSGDPTQYETVTYTPTTRSTAKNPGKWGDAWSDTTKQFGYMRPWRAVFPFDKVQGKTFTLYLTMGAAVVSGTPDIRIQKIVLSYHIERGSAYSGYSQT